MEKKACLCGEQSHLGSASMDPVDCNVASMARGPGKRQHHPVEVMVPRWQYLASQAVEASVGKNTKRKELQQGTRAMQRLDSLRTYSLGTPKSNWGKFRGDIYGAAHVCFIGSKSLPDCALIFLTSFTPWPDTTWENIGVWDTESKEERYMQNN